MSVKNAGLDGVQDANCAFLFAEIKMGIGVPGHLDFGVAEAVGDFLDVDTLIGEQTGVAMSEVLNAELTVYVLSCDNGEALLVDGVLPFLELVCIQLVDAGVWEMGKDMAL